MTPTTPTSTATPDPAPASTAAAPRRARVGGAHTMEALHTTTVPSPVGDLTLVASPRGVRALLWPGEEPARLAGAPGRGATGADAAAAAAVADQAVRELTEWFAGERTDFDVPIDPVGTPFQQQAWAALRTIPFGQTISYGAQARALGDPRKARAVGAANGRNPISIIVPCHRVVGANGSLTGFAAGVGTKAWLLDHEREVLARGATAR